jgi:hypothetical protein
MIEALHSKQNYQILVKDIFKKYHFYYLRILALEHINMSRLVETCTTRHRNIEIILIIKFHLDQDYLRSLEGQRLKLVLDLMQQTYKIWMEKGDIIYQIMKIVKQEYLINLLEHSLSTNIWNTHLALANSNLLIIKHNILIIWLIFMLFYHVILLDHKFV